MASAGTRRTGRRPGESGTREGIARAARRRFAKLGYQRTTIRAVAKEAGVDPALVMHFFGSKQRLFASVMGPPFDPEEVIPEILAGPRSQVGMRYARFAVSTLENPQSRELVTGMLRAAASEPAGARMVRETFAGRIVAAISERLDVADAELRASLVASQIIGVAIARYIIRVEPLASLDSEALTEAIAPTLQRYLTRPLGSEPSRFAA